MKIDRKLNLIVPVERDDGGMVHIHATPVSKETFAKHFKIISKTYTEIFKEGAAYIASAGSKVAMLMLRKVAAEEGINANELMTEIRRLSNIIVSGENGWESIPLSVGIQRGLIDEDDIDDAEGQIVFFICCSAMIAKKDLSSLMETICGFFGSQTVSSTCTEFAASLPILTQEENTTESKPDSSLPA